MDKKPRMCNCSSSAVFNRAAIIGASSKCSEVQKCAIFETATVLMQVTLRSYVPEAIHFTVSSPLPHPSFWTGRYQLKTSNGTTSMVCVKLKVLTLTMVLMSLPNIAWFLSRKVVILKWNPHIYSQTPTYSVLCDAFLRACVTLEQRQMKANLCKTTELVRGKTRLH